MCILYTIAMTLESETIIRPSFVRQHFTHLLLNLESIELKFPIETSSRGAGDVCSNELGH